MTIPAPSSEGSTVSDDLSDRSSGYKSIPEVSAVNDVKGTKIAVFASGRGTDFQAIIDANERGEVKLDIGLLVCNNKDAFVIQRAKNHSIPFVIMDHRGKERESYDREIDAVLEENDIGLIVLAGFMRILSPWFVSKWIERIVNIHPALLPSFPGAHAHRDVLDYGVKITGLTIHFVDEEVDHGPIIFQLPLEVMDDDDEESLSKRVLEQEHKWYPQVIQWIVDGRVRVEGRRVVVDRGGL
jgi:phosphoribosylglycinamide formyltransferase-1